MAKKDLDDGSLSPLPSSTLTPDRSLAPNPAPRSRRSAKARQKPAKENVRHAPPQADPIQHGLPPELTPGEGEDGTQTLATYKEFVVRVGDQLLVFRGRVQLRTGPRCVAQVGSGRRCTEGIRRANADFAGYRTWEVPEANGVIRAYEPDSEDQNYTRQRCYLHVLSGGPDAVAPEWEFFDPAVHAHLMDGRTTRQWTPTGLVSSWEGPGSTDAVELHSLRGELVAALAARVQPASVTALYRYFDAAEELLYVGITGDLAERELDHIRDSSWMEFAARSTIERFPTRQDALDAEREAIKAEAPLFNIAHNDTPGMTRRLVEYLMRQDRADLLVPRVSRG